MKKSFSFCSLLLFLYSAFTFAQVGIGTTAPQTTFEVQGKPADVTVRDGITIPKLTCQQLLAKHSGGAAYGVAQTGTLIYITDATAACIASAPATNIANLGQSGFYVFNGTEFEKVSYDSSTMAALSVKGNGTNASAVPTDIAAGTDGDVLRRSGATLGFGTIVSAGIADNTIINADLNNGASGVGGIYKGSGSLSGATTVTQGTNSLTFNSTATTTNPFTITTNSLTTGNGLLINLGNAALASPGTGLTISSTIGNTTGRLLNISYTGANLSATGRLLNISGDNIGPASGTGILANISANSIATSTAFAVTSTGSGLTTGRLMRIAGDSQTSGTLATISGTALTSGTALAVSVGNDLTTGKALSVTTGNITAGSGLDITTGTLGAAGKALSITTGTLGTNSSALNISSANVATNTDGVIKVTNTAASSTGTFAIFNANSTAGSGIHILNNGNVGIGTTSPTALIDVNGDTIRIRNAKTPTSSTSPGNAGDIAWDINFVYICVATNTWKRSALATW